MKTEIELYYVPESQKLALLNSYPHHGTYRGVTRVYQDGAVIQGTMWVEISKLMKCSEMSALELVVLLSPKQLKFFLR